jgi:hypothetical protein
MSVPGQSLLRDYGVIQAIVAAAFGEKVPSTAVAAAAAVVKKISSSSSSPPSAESLLAFSQEAAIWAVGCVGSSEPGYQLLAAARPDLFGDVLSAATDPCGDLGLRHTYFLAANLISSTPSAGRPLQTHGWDFGANPRGAVALPSTLSALFAVAKSPFLGSPATHRHMGQLAAPPRQTEASTVALTSSPSVAAAGSGADVAGSGDGACASGETDDEKKTDGAGGAGDGGAGRAKGAVLAAIANLTCALTSAEGKDSLLATQRDFAELAKAVKAGEGAAAAAAAAAVGAGAADGNKATPSEESPLNASPSGTVNVLHDASFYVDVFRGPLGASHLGVEHRRLVHHLFRGADFSP